MSDSVVELPKRITVKQIISSRYGDDTPRSENWSERFDGVDVVLSEDGEELSLLSDGQQSTPEIGWTLLLTEQTDSHYRWTLYGMKAA